MPHNALLTTADVQGLRRYLPASLTEALQFDLQAPPPALLQQCAGRLNRLAETTSAYLPADLVTRLAAAPAPGQPAGQFVEGTLLFADISGFTAMSEKLSRSGREGAEEITAVVNRYLSVMVAILHANRGQVMKFGGDAMLGLFPEPESALRATDAALAMQAAMQEFAETKTSQGTFPLRMKVGLHRGRFFAAQLGSAAGMESALFGRDVNLTAAAESVAQAGQVILDEATLKAIGRPCRAVPSATAPGYFVVEQLDAPDASPTGGSETRLQFEATPDGLRRATQVLDTLTPYLPAGLLSRLIVTTQILGFEGEHRLVAVLFANVHGLGDFADRLGPGHEATITTTLNRYFTRMAEAIQSFGGVINKIDLYDHGDKLVALFGAPVAHEDDAERAIRAALLMQETLKEEGSRKQEETPSLSLLPSSFYQHIGVNFGNVFAGYVGTRARREYSVIGDEVNLAARLMSVARTEQIIVSQALQRRVQTHFNFTPQGQVRLKGKAEPVSIFNVDGARAATAEREHALLRAPLIGREGEWHRLIGTVKQLQAGRGQIVSIIGEAGLGKTRLADELRRYLTNEATIPVRWVEGRCLSYTESVSYAPVQELIRRLIGAASGASEADTWPRLRAALTAVLTPEEATAHLPYLANFLNLHLDVEQQNRVRFLDAEALQRRTFIAVSALVEALSRPPSPPLLLVLEDIHWIDQASRGLVEYLFPLVNRARVGLILLYRPERTKVCWQIKEKAAQEYATHNVEVELSPLPAEQTQQLLGHLTPRLQWPLDFQQLILNQTEGNPLYLEELLRVLIENNVLKREVGGEWQVSGVLENLQVPDTLEGVMMTRLDGLDEPSRNTAQVAAVIGRSFNTAVLAHVTNEMDEARLFPNLERLQEYEIAEETQPAPERVFTFRHGLMQEVSYGSLMARIRRQVHRQIAEYIEGRTTEDVSVYPAIARHAFLGQDWPRALKYQTLAGQQAQRLFANAEAIDHLNKALQSAEALPADENDDARLTIHLALGELLTITAKYDKALEHLEHAHTLAAAQHQPDTQARAYRWFARINELRGNYPAAFEWIGKGLAVLNGAETAEAAELTLIGALIHVRQGDYETAAREGETARRIGGTLADQRVLARANNLLGITRLRNNPSEAVQLFARALELYQQVGDVQGQATANNLTANAYFGLGQWAAAGEAYRQARASFGQLGDVYRATMALSNLAGVERNQGQLKQALENYGEARQTFEKISASPAVRGVVDMNLGETHLQLNNIPLAEQHLGAARRLFEQTKSRDFLPELHRHLARAALFSLRTDEAKAEVQQALSLAQELNMKNEQGAALRVRGEIALSQKNAAAALENLTASESLLAEVADDYELARTRVLLGRALAQLNRTMEAHAAFEAAINTFTRLEAKNDLLVAQILRSQLNEVSN
jgi:class 3 adenylate cyclase/tetratricopeptide (TPR) repeat protein